ncbi:ArsR/SmtB family transcription factor [Haladaptatus sp. NG-WS-4]
MDDLVPSTSDADEEEDRDPLVVGVDSDDADELVAALSSQTGRDILTTLYEEPATPATIADRVDTSLQNVQYHLGKLENANLVNVTETMYSEKGREMKVYAPSAEPLVLFAGNESDAVGMKSTLSNLLGGLGVLGLASLVVQRIATGERWPFGGNSASDGGALTTDTAAGGSGNDAATTTQLLSDGTTANEGKTTVEAATTVADRTTTLTEATTTDVLRTVAEGTTATGLPPGLLFFAGGASILVLAFAVWYARTR